MNVLETGCQSGGHAQHTIEESTNTGACVELANLPPMAHIDLRTLAKMLKRSTKSVQRAVRRGDLPAPFKFLGKLTWMAGVIVKHLNEKQEAVLAYAARRDAKLLKHAA